MSHDGGHEARVSLERLCMENLLENHEERLYFKDLNSRFLVQAMTRIAHEVDVEVYAESVETESEREMLSGLYVNGCKGYLIGRPSADISE